MKKMASLLVVAALLICMAVPAFAATGINTYEEKLITYVKTAYVVDGTTISVPDEYVTALENISLPLISLKISTTRSRAFSTKLLNTAKPTTLLSFQTSPRRKQQTPFSLMLTKLSAL